jgi:hypothetical protein
MKLTKKLLGIAVIFAVIGFMVLPLMGCPEAGDNNDKKNTPTTETETQKTVYYPGDTGDTGDSIEEFAAWLAEQEEGVLCDVKLTLDDLGGNSYTEGSLGYVLKSNWNIKVKLDLSGSTFTSIGDSAFGGCNSLTGITIPNSVTSIGDSAFGGCNSLTGITIPNSVTSIGQDAFYGCTSLTSVTIGSGVTSINNAVFFYSPNLTSVTVDENNPNYASVDGILYNKEKTRLIFAPNGITGNVTISDSVTEIGSFFYCNSLTGITVDENNPNYASVDGILYNKEKTRLIFAPNGITGNVTIPNGVTWIEVQAFSSCTSLTGVTIPNSVTGIGQQAFYGCTSLTDITIPNSVTYIGQQAFSGCTSLAGFEDGILYNKEKTVIISVIEITGNVTIPNSVTSIPYGAFSRTSLTGITIPNSVTSIGGSAFQDCTGLTSVTIGSGVTSIEAYAFSGCTSLTDITIPDSVTSIGNFAFEKCYRLTGVTIPDSVTSIGQQAFQNCTGLTSITIGSGITSIGQQVFYGCTRLTSVTIPDSVTSIWYNAFSGCTSLAAINVDSGNSKFSSDNGVLYNNNKTTLVTYPVGKTGSTFTIPDGVTMIEGSAFSRCTGLTSITIPSSVTSIGSDAFYNCTSLVSVTIPNSVTSIGWGTFSGCTSLTGITFATGSNIPNANFADNVSPEGSNGAGGNTLKTAYNTASPKEGTYTRAANGSTWSKQ